MISYHSLLLSMVWIHTHTLSYEFISFVNDMNSYPYLSYKFIYYFNDMNSYFSFIHHMNSFIPVNPHRTDHFTNEIVYSWKSYSPPSTIYLASLLTWIVGLLILWWLTVINRCFLRCSRGFIFFSLWRISTPNYIISLYKVLYWWKYFLVLMLRIYW